MAALPVSPMLLRTLPIVLAVACVTALLLLYDRMQPLSEPGTPVQTHDLSWTLENGQRQFGPAAVEAYQGDTLRARVRSDQAVELHLHGYEKSLQAAPGADASLELRLDHSGRFELETHTERGYSTVTVVTVLPR